MEDLNARIHRFSGKLGNDFVKNAVKKHEEYLEEFPLEKLKYLQLEEYALGRSNKGSLCWWLEYNTLELGSIKGGNASKFIIYYSKKDQEWKYPRELFPSVEAAWEKLRSDLVYLLEHYGQIDEAIITEDSLLLNANVLRGKLLYLYYPEKLLPIYNAEHMHEFLSGLRVPKERWKHLDNVRLNLFLKEIMTELAPGWSSLQIVRFLYDEFSSTAKVYKVAPGADGEFWGECLRGGFIAVGWNEVGDLRNYPDYEEFKSAFRSYKFVDSAIKSAEKANELWAFFNLKPGDIVLANKGRSHILGIGTVTDRGYEYRSDLSKYKHIVHVDWKPCEPPLQIPPQSYWPFKTVREVKRYEYMTWIESADESEVHEGHSVHSFTSEEISLFTRLERVLKRKGQCILYGPPGTGKTYLARKFVQWKNESKNVEICTFHPSFNYEDFIEGYRPIPADDNKVAFQLEEGIFLRLCSKAQENKDRPYFLIIDEINRGNVPKIFGELITILEKDKRGVEIRLPQSKKPFSIPDNLYLIGTMNTSDRSIKTLDAALKRRFSFLECMPQLELIDQVIDALEISPAEILQQINRRLVAEGGRDNQIGHAYFMNDGDVITSLAELKEIYELEIIPLVQDYCFDDYSKLAEIIGDGFVDVENMRIRAEVFVDTDDEFISEITKAFKSRR